MSYFRCGTEFCSIVQQLIGALLVIAAIGGVISVGQVGLQLFSAR
jgi:hypothetical protein